MEALGLRLYYILWLTGALYSSASARSMLVFCLGWEALWRIIRIRPAESTYCHIMLSVDTRLHERLRLPPD
jgi:hypothetical protein